MTEIILKIDEVPQQHVGKGRAIVDPKIIEDQKWNSWTNFRINVITKKHM